MMKKHLPTLLSIASLLLIWQIIAFSIDYPAIFPHLTTLFSQIFELFLSVDFFKSVGTTISRALTGFAFTCFLSLVTGILAAFYPFWNRYFQPIVVTLRSIPVISVVLIALLWFNPENLPIFIVLITMFPIVHSAIVSGLQHVDLRLVEMSAAFGNSAFQTFIKIYIPSAKNLIISGVSTALGFGWRAVIIGEVLAQPLHGIGSSMKTAQVYLNISELFAWTFIAVITSYGFDSLIRGLSKLRFSTIFLSHKKHFQLNNDFKALKFNNISKAFSQKVIFSKVDFRFENSLIYLLKAPSGTGKTTLLRLAAGTIDPEEGIIHYQNIKSNAFSFQDARLCNWLTVRENIEFAAKKVENQGRITTDSLMRELELTDLAEKFPNELSGGQQQRVSLARALAACADLLILDEPLNGLDNELKKRIIAFVGKYVVLYKPIVLWATHEDIHLENTKEITLNN